MPKSIINQTQRMYSVTQLTHHMMLIAYIPHSFPLSSCQLEIISSSSQRIVGGTVDKIYIPIFSVFLIKSYSDINLQSTYFKYIAGSPIRRHFRRNKCIFKMSIRVPYSPYKLFRFVRCRFEEKLPKICDFWLCRRGKNGCGDFISSQNFIKST